MVRVNIISNTKLQNGQRQNRPSALVKRLLGKNRRKTREIIKSVMKPNKRDLKGVVYIYHIPHGFFEEQVEAYFSQFGKVTGVNVPRSKSGKTKGYAFIEYNHPKIAQIAADTMNNYFMMNRLLKAKYIPPNKQTPRLFQIAKEARENQESLAKKANLAVKHNRKIKNRHLKISKEVRKIKELLGKKNLLTKRMLNLGLSVNFEVRHHGQTGFSGHLSQNNI